MTPLPGTDLHGRNNLSGEDWTSAKSKNSILYFVMICHGIFRSCSDKGRFGIVFLSFLRPVAIGVPDHTIVGLPT